MISDCITRITQTKTWKACFKKSQRLKSRSQCKNLTIPSKCRVHFRQRIRLRISTLSKICYNASTKWGILNLRSAKDSSKSTKCLQTQSTKAWMFDHIRIALNKWIDQCHQKKVKNLSEILKPVWPIRDWRKERLNKASYIHRVRSCAKLLTTPKTMALHRQETTSTHLWQWWRSFKDQNLDITAMTTSCKAVIKIKLKIRRQPGRLSPPL